jgi:hypothetical protein
MKKILFIFLAFFMMACDPGVLFQEPQPEGKKDLQRFPARYQGFYMGQVDSNIYIIKESLILEKHLLDIAEPVADVLEEGDVVLTGDSILLGEMDLGFPAAFRNDSVFAHLQLYDTVFDIGSGNKLRKMSRSYFLNLESDSLWLVSRLIFTGSGTVYRCMIDKKTEMDLIRQHCAVDTAGREEGKTGKFILSPSRKELKKLLKLGIFTDTSTYVRLPREDDR